jgi:hypothetical protein
MPDHCTIARTTCPASRPPAHAHARLKYKSDLQASVLRLQSGHSPMQADAAPASLRLDHGTHKFHDAPSQHEDSHDRTASSPLPSALSPAALLVGL